MKNKTSVVVLAITLILSIGTVIAQEIIWDETPQVDVDHYMSYSTIIDEGTTLTVSIRTDGNAVDLFLMDSADFDDYEVGEYFLYYPVGSSTDVVQKEYTFIIPQTDRYYIVIENNNWVPVNVHLRAIAGEPYAPGFKAIFAIAGLLAVACIVRRRK